MMDGRGTCETSGDLAGPGAMNLCPDRTDKTMPTDEILHAWKLGKALRDVKGILAGFMNACRHSGNGFYFFLALLSFWMYK